MIKETRLNKGLTGYDDEKMNEDLKKKDRGSTKLKNDLRLSNKKDFHNFVKPFRRLKILV